MKTPIAAALLLMSSIAIAHPSFTPPGHAYPLAEVVHVQPRMVTTHEQVCEQVVVQRPAQHNYAGSILGAIAGAALGNQVGGGSGKTIATASGAVIGAQLGRGESQPGGYEYQNVCRSVPVTHQRGEVVTFKYKGKTFTHVFE
jgi:uncharacterized protein YcfJ